MLPELCIHENEESGMASVLENHDKSIRHKFSRFKMDKNHFYYAMNIELHHDLN